MNLGHCAVFYEHEQGSPGRVIVATSIYMSKVTNTLEYLSGFPADHERYGFDYYDLTAMYHMNALGQLDPKRLQELRQYSPEAVRAILSASPVETTVQQFEPLGIRHWINRRFDSVEEHVRSENVKAAEAYQAKRKAEREMKN